MKGHVLEFLKCALVLLVLFKVCPEQFWQLVCIFGWFLKPPAALVVAFWNVIATFFQLSDLFLNLHWPAGCWHWPSLVFSAYDCESAKAIVSHTFSGSLCQH